MPDQLRQRRWQADRTGELLLRKTRCPVSLDCEKQTQGPKRLQQESRRVHLRRHGRKADIYFSLLILVHWLPEQSNRLWIG